MKQLEKFSMPIYNILAPIFQKLLGKKSFEHATRLGLNFLDDNIIEEIKQYVISRQNSDGGFSDKAGNSDVYYSLFGSLLCLGLDLKPQLEHLRKFVRETAVDMASEQVDWICMVILYKKLIVNKKKLNEFHRELKHVVFNNNHTSESYFPFLGLMAFYYLNDYSSLFKLIASQEKADKSLINKPTPVLAAKIILLKLAAGNKMRFMHAMGNVTDAKLAAEAITGLKQALMNRFLESGGFRATLSSPVPDLLSTSVALYALRFANVNLSLIKPACLEFINKLYARGGFVASELDENPDIEYTFYGLLALGALSYPDK
jgi:hypothetical protein